jgi:HAD superfamily hydrolase (TIGR01549 family)
MSIQAVIFDMGGVLVRTIDPSRRDGLAKQLGVNRDDLEGVAFGRLDNWAVQTGRVSVYDHWRRVLAHYGWPSERLEEFRSAFWAGDVVDDALVDRIRGLRPAYRTGLLSNAMSDLRPYLSSPWGMADAFDVIVISAEEGVMKPDPAIYRIALERLAVRPEEAVFVDDFAHNIEAARALGMYAIHFRGPDQAWEELTRLLRNGY